MSEIFENELVVFYGMLLLCLIALFIPIIGKYIRLIETMIHELGHVVVSLLLGCPIKRVNLFSNTSGETIISAGKFKTILIAMVGYPFSSVVAFACFWAIANHFQLYLLYFFTALCIIFLLFYIRNAFGIFWTISLIAINIYVIYINKSNVINILTLLYAFVIFLESFLSTCRLFILSCKDGSHAGDAGILAKITHLPAVLFALLFISFNIFVSYYTIIYFFPLNINI